MSLTASEAARLMAVVVFPTPPFWLVKVQRLLCPIWIYVSTWVFHVERWIQRNVCFPHGSLILFHVKRGLGISTPASSAIFLVTMQSERQFHRN